MLQHCLPKGSLFTATDTVAHAFPVGQALSVYFWVAAANGGTVAIASTNAQRVGLRPPPVSPCALPSQGRAANWLLVSTQEEKP